VHRCISSFTLHDFLLDVSLTRVICIINAPSISFLLYHHHNKFVANKNSFVTIFVGNLSLDQYTSPTVH